MAQEGIKKSEFSGISTAADAATFDFVTPEGENLKITKADLVAALGFIGSIKQVGNATGAPVLDQQGTVNGIRTISNGSGISASINAWNGITLDHNFTVDAAGVPVLANPTALSPTLRSIVAGAGIAVSEVGNTIMIADSGVAASTKTVLVNQKSDLPAPVSGVITLAEDTNYLLANDISLGTDRIVLLNRTSILGSGVLNITLTYTGTGSMMSWVNADVQVSNLRISAASGEVFNGTNVSEVLRFQNISIETCDSIGTFTSSTSTSIRMTFFACLAAASDGITFSGTFGAFGHFSGLMTVNGGSLYGLSTAVFVFFTADTSIAVIGAGAIGISGLTGSGNIASGGEGRVINGSISGAGTPVSGISVDDSGWVFSNNNNFQSSRTDSLLSMQGNATATTITAASSDGTNSVLAAGTWVVEKSSRMTSTTAGRVTFPGDSDERLPVIATLSIEPATGSNISLSVYVAINGAAVASSRRAIKVSAGTPLNITALWQLLFTSTDYIEVFVENNDNTTNILVSSAVLAVN